MLDKVKNKLALAGAVIVPAVMAFGSQVKAAAVTYTPLISATDTKDTFDAMISEWKPVIVAIVVTMVVAGIAISLFRKAGRGVKKL